ncbi:hypothetical protein QFZ24_010070 [Streptomyces phaeochromogenes]|uniref:hypothetical protein n=1 Tax=Streptomyces phaeochromogenes TaxID=1923 RepID=UPI0027907051|nr:hypothetical protein [Streptomyces phaeochromogenes]MDQ0956061.1 hypothetical protein [Streptomyces phaeochromogenes]
MDFIRNAVSPAQPRETFSHPESAAVGDPPARSRRLDLELDAGARRLTVLEREHRVLQQAYTEMEGRLQSVERRLDGLMAARAETRDDVPSNAHSAHHIIAREYDALVEQRVQGLARAAAHSVAAAPPGAVPRMLRLMGQICSVLFGPDEPEGKAVLAAVFKSRLDPLAPQANRLSSCALDLRQRSAQTGLPAHWDFELVPGESLDEEWQEAWPSCDGTLPGQVVIAPAYLVAEQVFSRQKVCTGVSIPG